MIPSREPAARRKTDCKNRYGQNASGKWVRSSAFREIDYDPDNPDRLREFDSFDEAFAFDEARRLDGTGGRHAKPYPKPKRRSTAAFKSVRRSFANLAFCPLGEIAYTLLCRRLGMKTPPRAWRLFGFG